MNSLSGAVGNDKRRPNRVRLTICLLLFARILGAQALPLSTPQKEGFSPERLERLRQRFEEMVRDGKKAGAITMIVHNGKVVHWEAYGYRDDAVERRATGWRAVA
jgi:CubicO group peptidase (beta-lactamase class C family)